MYTVPAGKVAVVRCVTAVLTASGDEFALTISRVAHIVHRKAPAAVDYSLYNLRAVLEATETLSVYLYAGSLNMTVSGYLLDAP